MLLAACASGIRPLDSSAAATLAQDEGLLILHVDTDRPIDGVQLNGVTIASGVPAGNRVWLVRADTGAHRWTALRLTGPDGRSRAHRLTPDDEFRFDVEPGSVNYGGTLVVRSVGGPLTARNRNRAAMAIRMLGVRDAALVASHPLRSGARSEDGFLDHYDRERERAQESRD